MFDNFLNQTLWIGSVIRTQYRLGGFMPVTYDHYGIYEGLGDVIHFTKGKIRRTTLEDFANGSIQGSTIEAIGFKAKITEVNQPYESRYRARNLLGSSDYNVFFKNCEQFALYCKISNLYSTQSGFESNAFKKEVNYLNTVAPLIYNKSSYNEFGYSFRSVKNEEKIGMVVMKEVNISSTIDDLGAPGEQYHVSYFTVETRNPVYFERSFKSILLKYGVDIEGNLTFNVENTDDEGRATIQIDDFSFSVDELKNFLLELEEFLEDETEYYSCSLYGNIRC